MIKTLRYILAMFLVAAFNLNAQTKEMTVTIGAMENEKTTWVHLENGEVASHDANSWDFGFQLGSNAGIMANCQKGITVWAVPSEMATTWEEDIDTTGMAENWESFINSEVTWNTGAFNMNKNGFMTDGDFGWGFYDVQSHFISGKTVFVVKLADNSYKKVYFESLFSKIYTFKYANLDGSDEVTREIDKTAYEDKNYVYYSIENDTDIDPEPLLTDWHIVIGDYYALYDTGEELVPYPTAGVKTNGRLNIAQVDGVDPETAEIPAYTSEFFNTEIGEIGWDWKTYNFQEGKYSFAEDRVYFLSNSEINNPEAVFYKLYFKDYVGGADKAMTFDVTKIIASSIEGESGISAHVAVYPNVIERGQGFTLASEIFEGNEITLDILSLDGRMVESREIKSAGFSATSINPVLSPGMYMLRIGVGGKYYVEKLIVK